MATTEVCCNLEAGDDMSFCRQVPGVAREVPDCSQCIFIKYILLCIFVIFEYNTL